MKNSQIVSSLMFDYLDLSKEEIINLAKNLPPKQIRWLGENHPDNRTRKIFYRLTNVQIGKQTVINKGFIVSDDYEALLWLGSRVAISPNVTVLCASGPNNSCLKNLDSLHKKEIIYSKKVIIEDDVWIGTRAIIMGGVTIGAKSIIGAGSFVNKSVPPNSKVVGSPARVVGKID